MKPALLLTAVVTLAGARAPAQQPATPCCGIIAIDAATGIVTAKVTTNGNTFQFKVADARTLATLRVGGGVYANFAGKQVSLDGRTSCCTITSGPTAPPVGPAPAGRLPVSQPTAAAPPAPPPAAAAAPPAPRATVPAVPAPSAARVVNASPITASMVNLPPTVTFGPPQPRTTMRTRATTRFISATMTTQVAGRSVTAPVVYLRGLKAVDEAPSIPAGARRLLKMLVRRVPLGESDHYIVNTQMAQEWMAAHPPVPDNVKPTEPSEKKCGNWYDSWDCATEAVSDEWKRTYDHAVNEWNNAEKTMADAWETSVECFTERKISSGDIPIRFKIPNSMTVNLSQGASKGSAQGTVSGTATLGIPMQSDVAARLDLFYIPCLPFAIRPKALSANGVLTVGQELKVSLSATGSFNKTFTIPPTGGPVIPIQVFPIVIGGVPVAELDVSAYIEGEIEVSAEGKAEGQFQITNSNPTGFDFECSGKGCQRGSRGAAPPRATTTNESAQIQGTVSVQPAIYTALQLDFNYEALSARVGPQPYLLGVASGCAAAAGAQTAGGASTIEENHVLSADLDWGVELRAEALVLGKIVGNSYRTQLMNPEHKHLWFRDLAPGGSNALVASVQSVGPARVGMRTDHKVTMPSCYPYNSRVKYQVSWTGGATPAPDAGRSTACTWLPAQSKGTCTFDPSKEFVISLIWPTAGSYSLTVVPVGDAHDRVFMPAPKPTQLKVSVAP